MASNQIRIGQLAKTLNVQRFVIRFWEKEFNIKPVRSQGGQRFYTNKEVALFHCIKELLYEKGYTIAGAKRHLSQHHHQKVAQKTTLDADFIHKSIQEQLIQLQKQLIKLRESL